MSNHLLMAALKGTFGGGTQPTDAQFNNVAMLLHGEGSNGVGTAPFIASTSPYLTKTGTSVEGSTSPYAQNWSASFPGAQYFLVPTSTSFGMGTNDFTVEFWSYQTVYNANNAQILDFRSATSNQGLAIGFDGSGHLYYFDGPSGNQPASTAVAALNTWNHIALSRTSGVWRLFLNGTQVLTTTNADNLGSTQPIYIGTAINGTQYSFTGYMSNLRVVNGRSLYTTSSFTPPTGPLTAVPNTTLLTFQSPTLIDNSTNKVAYAGTGTSTGILPAPINPGSSNTYSAKSNGGSVYFNGSSQVIAQSVGSSTAFGTADFTVEAWVNSSLVQTAGTETFFIDARTASTTATWAFGLGMNSTPGRLGWFMGVTVTTIEDSSTTDLKPNTWNHIAYSRQSGTGRLFLNGIQVASGTDTSSYVSSGTLTLGSRYSNTYNVTGYMTDVRITTGTALYTAAFAVPTTPLVASANTAMLYNAQGASIYDTTQLNNWTTTGTAQLSTAQSKFGTSSAYFDGTTGSWMQGSNTTIPQWGSNNWTIEMWLYPTVSPQNTGLFTQRLSNAVVCPIALATDSNGYFNIAMSTNGTTSNVTIATTTRPAANAWGHFAVVRNGTTVTAYWNGASIGSIAISGALMNATVAYGLGAEPMNASASYTYKGYMDEFRITMGIARYTAAFTVPSTAFGDTVTADSYFGNVLSLLHFDGVSGAANTSMVATFNTSLTSSLSLTKTGVVTEGSNVPYGTNWGTYIPTGAYMTYGASTVASLGSSPFTIEAWVNFSSLPSTTGSANGYTIWQKGRTGTSNFEASFGVMAVSSGYQLLLQSSPDGTTVPTANSNTVALSTGVWYHMAVSCAGNTGNMNFWLNGVSQGTSSTSVTTIFAGSGACSIANNNNGSNPTWSGYISNLRVVIGSQVYASAFTPSTTPLAAITNTNMLTCQSNRFIDNSSKAWAIAQSGSPVVTHFNPFGTGAAYTASSAGGVALFDGSSGYVSSTSTALASSVAFGSNDFTVECWVNTSNVSNGTMMDTRTSSSNGWFFVFSTGNIYFGFNSNNISLTSAAIANVWTHVAYSRKNGIGRCFVNGVLTNTVTDATVYAAQQLLVGAGYSGFYLPGSISDARVTTGTALYTTSFTPNTAPMAVMPNTAFWYRAQGASTTGIKDNAMLTNVLVGGAAALSTTQAKFGSSSVYFASTSSYLQVPASQCPVWGNVNFTIEAWINPVSGTATGGLATPRSSSDSYGPWSFELLNGTLKMLCSTGSGWQVNTVSTATVSANTWTHVAMVRNGTTVTGYINGVSVCSGTVSGSLAGQGTAPLIIGSNGTTGSSLVQFNGYMDEFRITYGVARYTSTFTVPNAAFPDK